MPTGDSQRERLPVPTAGLDWGRAHRAASLLAASLLALALALAVPWAKPCVLAACCVALLYA
eukprot:scaffold24058_cov61-Phaeocystis_antarctica.AAC.2